MLLYLYMLLSVGMNIAFREAKIYRIDLIDVLVKAHEEVFGFYISVNKPTLMNDLDSHYLLIIKKVELTNYSIIMITDFRLSPALQ